MNLIIPNIYLSYWYCELRWSQFIYLFLFVSYRLFI